MRKAIVNYSTEKYRIGQDRLLESLAGQQFDQYFFSEESTDIPTHEQSMYAFKVYSIDRLRRMGYDIVLWLDASMVAIKGISPIFDHIEKHGYFFQDSGWANDRWTTQAQAEYFGTNSGKMISAGVIGLNFNNHVAIEFFKRWHKSMEAGMFIGSHNDNRHDQTCASLIIEQLKMDIIENNTYWCYGKSPVNENIVILADGIV